MDTLIMLVLAVLGFGSATYGIAQWSRPAGWVAFGGCCLVAAVWPFLREKWFL